MASENPPHTVSSARDHNAVTRQKMPCVPSLASALVVRRSQHIPPGKPLRAEVDRRPHQSFRSPQHWRFLHYAPKCEESGPIANASQPCRGDLRPHSEVASPARRNIVSACVSTGESTIWPSNANAPRSLRDAAKTRRAQASFSWLGR